MDTKKISGDTRRRTLRDVRSGTGRHDFDGSGGEPPEGTDEVPPGVRPGKRFVLLCCFLLATVAGAALYRAAAAPSPAVATASPQASPPQQRVLLEDPVCKKPVDPASAEWILEIDGHTIYFDSEECLTAYRNDPFKYARKRVRVKISTKDGTVVSESEVRGTASPSVPTLDDPAMSPSPNGTGGPVGDGPLQLPPDAPPDEGPQPSPSAVGDAPSVTEQYPNSVPTGDMPARAPKSAPEMGPDGKGTSKAPAAKAPARKPGPVQTFTPDDNGFSIPPVPDAGSSTSGAPASRPRGKTGGGKTGGGKHAPPPSTGDGPPSVDEPPPDMQ